MKAVKMISLFVLILNVDHAVLGLNDRTSADRIQSAGYSSESHNLITHDGYTLTIFRVGNSTKLDNENNKSRPVVLMMHGLSSSSDIWLITRPEDVLAFNLVDSGYDVWLGNCRGNPYGSRHISKSIKDPKFWRFSWHEIGMIDLPNMIDYIVTQTGQLSLHYVGHSQGTTVLFVLLSTQPEYNNKLRTIHLLAPIAYMKYARAPLIRMGAPFVGTYTLLDPLVGDLPFLQQPILRQIFGYDKCHSRLANPEYCSLLLFLTGYGGVSAYFNKSLLPEIYSTNPASCSAHQAIHLIQLHVSGRFRPYDFGIEGNQQRYNRSTPPDYEVENINPRFPLHFYYSNDDELSTKTDVEHFSRILGNKSVKHFIDLKRFTHLDFMFARNVKLVINRDILHRMNEAELLLQKHNSNDL